jgi:dnd system-associated protein 4
MRGVRRDKKYAHLTDILTTRNPRTNAAVFPSKKALQCYAAMLGFETDTRIPLPSQPLDSIEWHTFGNESFTDYIYLIALAATKDLDVLRYDVEASDKGDYKEDMVTVFEEFANGGFEIIQSYLDKDPADRFGTKAILAGLKRNNIIAAKEDIQSTGNFPEVVF